MAIALRISLAIGIAALATAGITWEIGRWAMHRQKSLIERSIESAMRDGNPVERSRVGRAALELLERRTLYPADIDLRLEAAAAHRLIGQFESAEREYLAVLDISDRPEIHIALGNLYLETGRTEEALDHYTYAVRFGRQNLNSVPAHRREVLRRVEELEREIRNGQ